MTYLTRSFVIVLLTAVTSAAYAGPLDMTRRSFLVTVGGAAVSIAVPSEVLATHGPATTIPNLPSLAEFDADIFAEGWASLLQFIIEKRSSPLGKAIFAPNWRSLVGVGGWLKLYSNFQEDLPEVERYSFESDKAFVKYVNDLMLNGTNSAQELFLLAHPDQVAETKHLDGLIRLSMKSMKLSGVIEETEGLALGLMNAIQEESNLKFYSMFEMINETPSIYVASNSEASVLEHVMGHSDYISRARPINFADSFWSRTRKEFLEQNSYLSRSERESLFTDHVKKLLAESINPPLDGPAEYEPEQMAELPMVCEEKLRE